MKDQHRETASIFVLSTSCFVLCLSGCSSSGDFRTAPTAGKVMCEGKPVPFVMVFFEPLETGKSGLTGKQGFDIADENGNFSISTYGKDDGAVIGHHRVRVGRPHAEDHPNFKCDCVLNPEIDIMEVDIKKGKNEFEVVLKKRTGREAPLLKD